MTRTVARARRPHRWRALLAALLLLGCAAPAAAQTDARWGIAASVVPRWEFLELVEDPMERDVEMQGTDVRVGIVRGRDLGGEWGISYVRRQVDDDSVVVQQESLKCVARDNLPDVCARGTLHRTRGANMTGVQLHRFFPIGTMARRVQVGAVVTGGIARLRGSAEQVQEHLQVVRTPPTGATTVTVASESSTVEARHIFDDTGLADYIPIGGVEAAVAVIVAPGVKLRASSGVSFPGFHVFGVTIQYLIGGKR